MPRFTLLCCFLCTFVFVKNIVAAPVAERPNIIFIFTDDHAYQAIGAYGSNRNTTPHLDRLANEGMRFTNCCVTNSICGPSRAVILTGKYSHINGFMTNSNKFDIEQPIFPKMLQEAGYQTAIVGKWHLACPATKGFDYSEVLISQGTYYNPEMIRDGTKVRHEGYVTEITTQLSLNWLQNRRDKSKPFMLMAQHKAPHREWDPYPKYYAKYKNVVFPYPETFDDDYSNRGRAALEQFMSLAETMNEMDLKIRPPDAWKIMSERQKEEWHEMFDSRKKEYAAVRNDPVKLKKWKYQCYMKDYMSCVDAVDESIGEMLKFLDESGQAENTIVVYSSDQGFYLGEHGWFDKRFMYQESFKTPLLVRWPNHVKPGSVNNDIVSNIDFAQTFLEVAGVKAPADMQGRSLVPILQGKTPNDWRKSFYYHYYEYPGPHMIKKHEGVYDGRYKLIHFYDDIDEWEFYDLEKDPNELKNVHADSESRPEIQRLTAEMDRLKKELKVPETVVNTKSLIFSDEPTENKMIEQLRKIVPEREKQLQPVR